MATEIVHEHDHTTDGSGSGLVVGLILLVVFLLFLWYAAASGAFRGFFPTTGSSSGVNLQVPDKVNVNLNQGSPAK